MCDKTNACHKLKIVLDKGYDLSELYALVMKQTCLKCSEKVDQNPDIAGLLLSASR